jgi:hypothetical protein
MPHRSACLSTHGKGNRRRRAEAPVEELAAALGAASISVPASLADQAKLALMSHA